jgi:hypothetical protein
MKFMNGIMWNNHSLYNVSTTHKSRLSGLSNFWAIVVIWFVPTFGEYLKSDIK